jgi:6-phosphogluconate dehydrogenase
MQLGMIGLGRMGANLVRRLLRAGHQCVVFDRNRAAVDQLAGEGAVGAASLEDLVARLDAPRAAWVMVPAGVAGRVVEELGELMGPDDVVIDGGNSYYRDDVQRAEALQARGVHFLDVGTSGGVFGLERGYCLMIGGEAVVVTRLRCSRPWCPGWRRPSGPRAARAPRRPRSWATSTVGRSGPAIS